MAPKAKDAAKRKAAEKPEVEPPAKKGAKETPKEDTKKKAAEKAEAEPPAKKVKDDSGDVEKNEPADKRPVTKTSIAFNSASTTLNVIPSFDNKVLMSLTEGGMQYLIAGARGSAGMKAGRYAFEMKIIEALNPTESTQGMKGRTPQPRQLARLGFSTAGSALILGDSDDCVYFDSEGNFCAGKSKKRCSQPFSRDQVICVVLNLDPKSPNANTMSLFREGVRLVEPQPLPECLHGKPLFPHICFRNVTVQVNLGPSLLKPLPFNCRAIQAAAGADIVESGDAPKDGEYEVVLPVAVPDEGTFDWLDGFLEANPSYTELSERKLQAWAASSGLQKPKAPGSNDKPAWNYGIPSMDDLSLVKVANSVASTIPRNYVMMEVSSNLVAEERAATLKRFSLPHFKKTAMVVMGEPPQDFKDKNKERLLQEKQAKSDAEWKAKKAEAERQKAVTKRQKALELMRKQAEEQRVKRMEEAQKKLAEAQKKKAEEAEKKKAEEDAKKKAEEGDKAEGETKEGETKEEETKEGGEDTTQKMEVDEVKEEEKKEEKKEEAAADAKDETKAEAKEEVKEEEAKVEEEEEEDDGLGDEPPKVELTEEDLKQYFRPKVGNGDLQPAVLGKFLAKFTIPEKSEGFGDVKYIWDAEETSKTYLRNWIVETKRTMRIEDLEPSKYFTEKLEAWKKQFADWQAKQKAFKAAHKTDAGEEKKLKDISTVEDINDVGDGEPLYGSFEPQDWALLQLRYEMFLLADAYKKDLDDADREQIPEVHLAFYYSRYYKKQLNPAIFTLKTPAELVDLVKSTATIDGEPRMLTLKCEDAESLDFFVKQTEEARRELKRRSDAGDETAVLKYNAAVAQAAAKPINTVARLPVAQASQPINTQARMMPGIVPGVRPALAGLAGKGGGLAGLLSGLTGAAAGWKGAGKW
eukprot:TRINITY_DN2150_c0_g1_i1.p1 TRINITY_DN2150_c0_g1~~TRINITY_DN2150_c0_g1_i1.p1  ORF type:complete len:921 (+),score=279.57 TRINITY_DN2150_c0_g1_i1:51-2813(+)